MLDMTESIAPKSDQLNADDLLAGPRTFTIEHVKRGSDEQPIDVHLVETPGRPWRPSKTDRRVLVAAWGVDGDLYAGRRITLYRDPKVKWGGQEVGGIRVQAMSHLTKRLTLAMTVTRGKKAPYVVEPLPDPAPAVEGITQEQSRKLVSLVTAMGLDKDGALALLSDVAGRPVEGSKQLTRTEADAVIAELEAGAAHEPEGSASEPTDEPPLWPETATVPQ